MKEKRRVIGAAGGALGLSGFAAAIALCCSLPWAVALLGVTGAVAFARLSFLLPYALVGSALLLGIGFWAAYRKPADCDDGSCVAANRRKLQWFVWIAAVIVAAMAVVVITSPVMPL